jgi:polyisoprenoid-binding protein YceI
MDIVTENIEPRNWEIDKEHSGIEFSVRHMMISHVNGRFKKFSVEGKEDLSNVEKSTVIVKIDSSSIETGNMDRDNHLKSPDFLKVDEFPEIVFRSTSIKKNGDNFKVAGNLKIRDVEKPYTFDVERSGPIKDPYGNLRQGISLTGTINRKDYGLVWNMVLEGGGVMVGDGIKININLELVQVK